MIINVKVMNGIGNRKTVSVDASTTTVRQAFEQSGLRWGNGMYSIDSEIISDSQLDDTLESVMEEYEVEPNHTVFLMNDNKSQNA